VKHFVAAMDTVSEWVGKVVSHVILVIIAVVSYEVIVRFAFNSPTIWAHETTELIFGIYAILAGGYCLLHGKHVRVDIWWGNLSPKGKAIADISTGILAFSFIIALAWLLIPWVWHSVLIQETSITVFGPPLYPSKVILLVATFLLFLQMIAETIRNSYVVTGKSGPGKDLK